MLEPIQVEHLMVDRYDGTHLAPHVSIRTNQLPVSVTRVPDMFCDLYSVKKHKIANNSTTTEAREKISKT